MSGSDDPRMCQTCGERPRSGAYSNCFECRSESQARQIEARQAETARLRRRLDVAVAFKDAERGRPLTAGEKLVNLKRWLDNDNAD
jgi:hypothetical protein